MGAVAVGFLGVPEGFFWGLLWGFFLCFLLFVWLFFFFGGGGVLAPSWGSLQVCGAEPGQICSPRPGTLMNLPSDPNGHANEPWGSVATL